MSEAMRLDDDFGRTGSIGTREILARDDTRFYHSISQDAMLTRINECSLVQYVVHPTTHNIYATDLSMYSHPYNMLEALPSVIPHFHRLGFGRLVVVYMVCQPTAWREWFETRYPVQDDERRKRAKEALDNLEWAMTQPANSLQWVENIPGDQVRTAQRLINITKHNDNTPNLSHLATEMREIATSL